MDKELASTVLNLLKQHRAHKAQIYFDVLDKLEAFLEKPDVLGKMREMLEIQGKDGNWNYDSYMHGMYNGMECLFAVASGNQPKYREAPKEWLEERVKEMFESKNEPAKI